MKNKGFTLLEITIVVSIIIVLGTIFVANYRGGEKQFALKRSAHQLSQDLRRAQEMAMSGKEFKGTFQGGYGIHLTEGTGQYTLFVDCDNESDYDTISTCDDCTGAGCVEDVFPETIETFYLEEGIEVSELSPASPLDIIFFPPEPTVTINGNPDITAASTTLTFQGEYQKIITVNKAGLIDIE